MSKKEIVSIQKVSYKIKNITILRDITIRIFEKEIVSILGYNGAGKSTLLKLILGEYKPTYGNIYLKPHIKIGYVPQKLSFDRELPLTVKDFFSIYHLNSTEVLTLQKKLPIINIGNLWDKPISGLSGGQLQKVLIYSALIGNPNLLILDEPVSGLDIHAQKSFYEILDYIHQKIQCTIIMVSHDVNTVYNKSDKVICLNQGVCSIGKPDEENIHKNVKSLFGSYISPYSHKHDT